MDPADALVEVVDERDHVLEVRTRREVVAEHLLHRCTYALVRRSAGAIYVQRRTDTKDLWPGAYDMLPGGICDAGETYEACIRRELAEELGIAAAAPVFLRMHRYEAPDGRAWGGVYMLTWDGPVLDQREEVAWSGWVSPAELAAMIRERTFCADSLEIYRTLEAEGLL